MLPKVAARSPIPEVAFGLREGDGEGAEGRDRGFGGDTVCCAGGGLLSSSSALLLEVLENGRRHRIGSLITGDSSRRIVRGNCASRCLDAALLIALVRSAEFLKLSSGCRET